MAVLKKNLFSIICGVVAILSGVALYWPLTGMYADLDRRLGERIAVDGQISQIVHATRTMPLLSPDNLTPDPLPVFPRDEVITAATDAVQQVDKQAAAMVEVAVKANTHTLLLDGELPPPDPKTGTQEQKDAYTLKQSAFAKKYAEETAGLVRWQKMLNSGALPTTDEINARKATVTQQIKDQLIRGADAEIAARVAAVPVQMQNERAVQSTVYMQPDAIGVDKTINPAGIPTAEKICAVQIAMWTIDDIVAGIARANKNYSDVDTSAPAGHADVPHAAVKQIIKIDNWVPVNSPNGGDNATGLTNPVPKVPTLSPSGRVCNALYDTVRFNVSLVVDASKLNQIIQELETNQFITILNVTYSEVVDPAIAANNGYRFGDKPLLSVTLDCEELLMHQWTNPLLPDAFKNGLGKGQAVINVADPTADPNAQ
jgi:hypothetical protein